MPHEVEFQNLLWQKPCEGAQTDSRAKFGKETIAGAHRRPKWVQYYGAQGVLRVLMMLRLCSGILTLGSG
jgi:hypothetical protein